MSSNLPTPHDPFGGIEPVSAETRGLGYRQLPTDAGGGNNLRVLWRRVTSSIWRYKWLTLAILAVGSGVGFMASQKLVQPKYAVQARLWVDPSRQEGNHGPIQTSRMLDAAGWTDLLRSFAVIEPVVRDLHLYIEPKTPIAPEAFASFELEAQSRPGHFRLQVDGSGQTFTLFNESGVVLQQGQVGEPVGTPTTFRWTPPAELLTPGQQFEFVVRRPRDVARHLASQLQVTSRERGSFIILGLVGEHPEYLARVLGAITHRFVDVAGELKRAQSQELTELLQEQLTVAARNLQDSEAALQGFRVGTVTLPSDRVMQSAPGLQMTQGTVFSDFFSLKVDREQMRRDREAIQAALGRNGGGLSITALEVVPSVREASELSRALGELAEKRAELRAMRNQFTDQYAPLQRLAEEVQILETQSVPRLASQVVAEIAQREAEMDSRLTSASSELRQIPQRSIEEARLERSVAIAADLYRLLRQRYETARLAAVSTVPDVQILDEAAVPSTPVNEDERLRLFLMVFLVSVGIAVGTPVLLDRLDARLRYPEQVTNDLGLPILGAVPHIAAANGKRRALRSEANTAAVEALREIRLNVTHAFGSAGPLLTTVTSPGAGDGKSFITSNLALAFADLGHRTLIIDGDIRRGQLHRLLGAVRVPGLTDFLSGNATDEEIIQPTAYESLDLIACGTRMQMGPELLGSAAMSALVRDLRTKYDVILVDSPPLGAGVDPFLLSTLTGNTLLVVRTGRTNREFAMAKLDLLDRLPVRLLGAVLNDVPPTGVYKYYSYVPGYESENEGSGDGELRQLEKV